MVASCAPHWGALLVSMHSFQARPGLPVSAWGRESAPLLHVSGTVPGGDRIRRNDESEEYGDATQNGETEAKGNATDRRKGCSDAFR